MELNNETTWLDLKTEMAFSVAIQLEYSLRCWVISVIMKRLAVMNVHKKCVYVMYYVTY